MKYWIEYGESTSKISWREPKTQFREVHLLNSIGDWYD